jgi:hypothetical protein
MKALHLTAYGNPAQNLRMVEVFGGNLNQVSQH